MKRIIRSRVRLLLLGLTVICVALPLVWRQLHTVSPTLPHAAVPAPPSGYGQVPLSFEANHGQANEPVKFLARGSNANFQVTPGAYQSSGGPALIKMNLPRSAVTVSAADYSNSPLASEAIASAFGTGLAVSTQNAATLPLPMVLAGTTVKVKDSAGTEREAALFFVSPTQVNFQLPAGTANGNARITITAQNGSTFVSNVEITNVAPAIFSADTTGRGLAAAQVQRGASVNFEPMVKVDPLTGQLVAVPFS